MTGSKKTNVQAQLSKKFVAYVRANPDFYPDTEAFLTSLDTWPQKATRANTHVTTIEKLCANWSINFDQVPWCGDATYFPYDKKLGSTHEHEQGFCYVGDPSAMLAVECVDIAPDAFVVDMCAAPGGKSIHALNFLGPDGTLIANDVDPRRVRVLQENVDRMLGSIPVEHRPTVKITNSSAADLAEAYAREANLVILDAPCSGEAMMKNSNIARRQWSEKLLTKMSTLQKMLLMHAKTLLQPGGKIAYSTCTFNGIENEGVVEFGRDNLGLSPNNGIQLLDKLAKKNLQRGSDLFVPAMERDFGISIYPHLARGNGQFAAVLSN